MTKSPAISQRVADLDALGTTFVLARNDRLAELLTDADVATLKHLYAKGTGANTLRAYASDLAYFEAWALAATGEPLPWPTPQALVLKFVAHHLWDPAAKAADEAHGMPGAVTASLIASGTLRKRGPHAPSTVRRRLANLATLHRWRGLASAASEPEVKRMLTMAARAAAWQPGRHSERAITRDILDQLLDTCKDSRLLDIRDRALLLLAFASGGRRRSEVAGLCVAQLRTEPSARETPEDPSSPLLPCLSIALPRTKTSRHGADASEASTRVFLVGRAVVALREWLEMAAITEGAVFRGVDRHGRIAPRPLTEKSVNQVVKRRCKLAGLDPAHYSAHGLRSGFLTSAARRRVPMAEAMAQSQHRSVQQASRYYNEAERSSTAATRLAE